MNKFISIFISVFFIVNLAFSQAYQRVWKNQQLIGKKLKVSENQKFLVYNDGTPFFWLGDTAWELFHRLNREEADLYLDNRAKKGFTVIQAVALAELEGETRPNAYGEFPLIDRNPAKPNEKYFEHVDYIVNKATEHGMFIGLLPTWGIFWKTGNDNNRRLFTADNARLYGEYLGKRYKDKPIVWILGGDQNPENEEEKAIIVAMAEGLHKGDSGANLITFHPRGPGRSSDYFHQSGWLDFNMYQSSHAAKGFDNGLFAELDRKLIPAKPTLDGEPRYENIMTGFYYQGNHPADRFTNYDVRTAAYWSILAGACGHTYGNNNIWQMWREGENNVIGAEIPWFEAIDHPGSFDMMHMRRFFESLEWQKLQPAQEIILDAPLTGAAKTRAAVAHDGSFLVVYAAKGESFTLNLDSLKGNRISESWFDPRYGTFFNIHNANTFSVKTYSPPSSGEGNDWLLLVKVTK